MLSTVQQPTTSLVAPVKDVALRYDFFVAYSDNIYGGGGAVVEINSTFGKTSLIRR